MRFKFINCNLWLGGKLWENMIPFLKKEDPDILVCQEVYNGKNTSLPPRFHSVESLPEVLGLPYFQFAPAFIHLTEVGKIETGNAVFSRFPLKPQKTVFYDVPFGTREKDDPETFTLTPRNLQHVQVNLVETVLDVFNTQGIWGTDGEDNPRRIEMGKIIADEIGREKNFILSGDFNVKEGTQTISQIESVGMNVFKGELKTSFNLKIKKGGGFASAVVDMIFVSQKIKIISHNCPDLDVSDHLPLVCVFEI